MLIQFWECEAELFIYRFTFFHFANQKFRFHHADIMHLFRITGAQHPGRLERMKRRRREEDGKEGGVVPCVTRFPANQ